MMSNEGTHTWPLAAQRISQVSNLFLGLKCLSLQSEELAGALVVETGVAAVHIVVALHNLRREVVFLRDTLQIKP